MPTTITLPVAPLSLIPASEDIMQAARLRLWDPSSMHWSFRHVTISRSSHAENLALSKTATPLAPLGLGRELATARQTRSVGVIAPIAPLLAPIPVCRTNMRHVSRPLIEPMSCTPSARAQVAIPELLAEISSYLTGIDDVRFRQAFRMPTRDGELQAMFRRRIAQILGVSSSAVQQLELRSDAKSVFLALRATLKRHADRQLPYGSRRLPDEWAQELFTVNSSLLNAACRLTDAIHQHEENIEKRNRRIGFAIIFVPLTTYGLYCGFSWNNALYSSGGMAHEGWRFDLVKRVYEKTKPEVWYETPLRWVFFPRTGYVPIYPVSPREMWWERTIGLSLLSAGTLAADLFASGVAALAWQEAVETRRDLYRRMDFHPSD